MPSFFKLKQLGHSVDKVEFIVMGGTFMALSEEYRDYFIRNLHDALSGHTSNSVAEAVKFVLKVELNCANTRHCKMSTFRCRIKYNFLCICHMFRD